MREYCLNYYRYLVGNCKMPRTLVENVIFTCLMAICMGLCMVTVAAVVTQMPTDSYTYVLTHVLPPMIAIGAAIRLFVLEKPISYIIRKHLVPHFKGFTLSFTIVLVNVLAMATIMCALGTAVGCVLAASSLDGLAGFTDAYFAILPIIYVSALLISLFIAGPFVKMLFNKLDELYQLRYWGKDQK